MAGNRVLVHFELEGEPRGKGRPRFTKSGHTYTPDSTTEYEQAVQWAYKAAAGGFCFPTDTPLRLVVWAFMERPKSASRITRQLMGAGKLRPTKKPDWDNIGKIVCDALNGIAYGDDTQIVDGRVIKLFCADGEKPHISVTVSEVLVNPRVEKGSS